jgi:hypothetical protein
MKKIKELDDQVFYDKEKVWKVSRLIILSHDLEVMEIPLKHLNIFNLYPILKSTMDFVNNVKRVNEADLDCPIILDEEGYIMDGRHRLAKALLLEKETIKAVRFEETPSWDYTREYKEGK